MLHVSEPALRFIVMQFSASIAQYVRWLSTQRTRYEKRTKRENNSRNRINERQPANNQNQTKRRAHCLGRRLCTNQAKICAICWHLLEIEKIMHNRKHSIGWGIFSFSFTPNLLCSLYFSIAYYLQIITKSYKNILEIASLFGIGQTNSDHKIKWMTRNSL